LLAAAGCLRLLVFEFRFFAVLKNPCLSWVQKQHASPKVSISLAVLAALAFSSLANTDNLSSYGISISLTFPMLFLGTLSSMFLPKNPFHLHDLLADDIDFLYLQSYAVSLCITILSLCSALTFHSLLSQAGQMFPAFFRARSPLPTDGSSLLDESTFLASQASIGGSTSDSLSTGTSFRALGGASNNLQPFRSIANSDTGTFMHTYTYIQHRMSSRARIILLSVFYAPQENIIKHRASSCSNLLPYFVSKIHICIHYMLFSVCRNHNSQYIYVSARSKYKRKIRLGYFVVLDMPVYFVSFISSHITMIYLCVHMAHFYTHTLFFKGWFLILFLVVSDPEI
jgi:hypothetical protein